MSFDFKEADKQIRSAATIQAGGPKRNMIIGWHGANMKALNKWPDYGYKDEAAYRDAAGVPGATWGRYVRIAGYFLHLPIEDFIKMSAENAEALSGLSLECRNDFTWVFEAITLPAEQFKKKVLAAKAKTAGIEPKDMRVKFSLPLFEAQRTVITDGIDEFAKEHQIKDKGTALEWLVLEYSARKTFIKFIQEQLPVLKEALSSDELFLTQDQLKDHILALASMLQNLKG